MPCPWCGSSGSDVAGANRYRCSSCGYQFFATRHPHSSKEVSSASNPRQEEAPYRQSARDRLEEVLGRSNTLATDLTARGFPVDRRLLFATRETRSHGFFSRSRTETIEHLHSEGWVLHWDFYDRQIGYSDGDPILDRRQVGTLLAKQGQLVAYDMPAGVFGAVDMVEPLPATYDDASPAVKTRVSTAAFVERDEVVPKANWGDADAFFRSDTRSLGMFKDTDAAFYSSTTSHRAKPVPTIQRLDGALEELARRARVD